MHLSREMHPKTRNKLQLLIFAVTLLEAIDTTGFLLEVHVTRVKRMVLRINLAVILTAIGIHRAAGFKFGTITHYNCDFVVFWMNSVFHECNKFLYELISVGKDNALSV